MGDPSAIVLKALLARFLPVFAEVDDMQFRLRRENSGDKIPERGAVSQANEAAASESVEWRAAVSNLCTYSAWLDQYGSWRNFLLNLPRKRP